MSLATAVNTAKSSEFAVSLTFGSCVVTCDRVTTAVSLVDLDLDVRVSLMFGGCNTANHDQRLAWHPPSSLIEAVAVTN